MQAGILLQFGPIPAITQTFPYGAKERTCVKEWIQQPNLDNCFLLWPVESNAWGPDGYKHPMILGIMLNKLWTCTRALGTISGWPRGKGVELNESFQVENAGLANFTANYFSHAFHKGRVVHHSVIICGFKIPLLCNHFVIFCLFLPVIGQRFLARPKLTKVTAEHFRTSWDSSLVGSRPTEEASLSS